MAFKVDFPETDVAVEWTLIEDGVHREEVAYHPRFYVATRNGASFDPVTNAALSHPDVVGLTMLSRRPGWRHDEEEMLAIDVASLEIVDRLATSIARLGRPGDYRLFNVDLSREFRYCLETETDPTSSREMPVPRLSAPPTALVDGFSEISVSGTALYTSHSITGGPEEIATEVASLTAETDPDVLQVSEARLIPILFEAGGSGYQLGREPGFEQLAGESTFESYGRVGHSPARFNVPGRAIVDESNTFFLKETNLDGILDMVSRSWKPLQEAAWASIGNILTALQIRTALESDVLVPWRAWRPEFYKYARTLDESDRGGFTFAHDVGVHEDVHEIDFSSLYPNIMVMHNISPETVCCECHPDREDVPGIDYNICPDEGYLPGVLKPLRMVSSYLQLIEQRYSDALDEDGEEFLEYAVDGADRMRSMINGLLTYSRVETQGDPFGPVDLADVLDDVREILQMKIAERDAEITAGPLPRVEGDESQLHQVFQNLLANAIEYSGEGPPRIQISAERTGSEWTVSVADEGIGIDREDQERIFEALQRVHGSGQHSETGIGLALCERIVERHGGEIWVDSEPGEGATFSFTLPAVQMSSNE